VEAMMTFMMKKMMQVYSEGENLRKDQRMESLREVKFSTSKGDSSRKAILPKIFLVSFSMQEEFRDR
jgi:hypothetical protein